MPTVVVLGTYIGFAIHSETSQERLKPRLPNLRSATIMKDSLNPSAEFEIYVPQAAAG